MRIIKLSSKDPAMKDRDSVDTYFNKTLLSGETSGQFLFTKGRIAEKGIVPGEVLVFSYNGEIVYLALSSSERETNTGPEANIYPFYFCIDINTLKEGKGTLIELEKIIGPSKHIAQSRGWPSIKETPELRNIWEQFEK